MTEQELFIELAVAEKNARKNPDKKKMRFLMAVRNAFIVNNVDSFLDLVAKDSLTAFSLRDMAVQENLL
jgi:hypothetical protein